MQEIFDADIQSHSHHMIQIEKKQHFILSRRQIMYFIARTARVYRKQVFGSDPNFNETLCVTLPLLIHTKRCDECVNIY